jgi:hypothetical protein
MAGRRVEIVGIATVVRRAGRGAVLAAAMVALAACGSTASAPATTGATEVVRAPTCPPGPATGVATPPATTTRAGVHDALVPAAPVAAVVCRYPGPGTTATRSSVVPEAALPALVTEMDSTRWPVISRPATYSCPMWDGSEDVAGFAYPSGPDVTVVVDVGGCGFASNGTRTVNGYDISRYLARWLGS